MNPPRVSRSGFGFAALLVVLTILAYAPVFRAEFIWDDDMFITDNALLHDADGLRTIWFAPKENPQRYPLLLTLFWLQYRVFGVDPTGYHIVTLFFHVLASLAVWRLAKRVVPAAAPWCALIFALHPMQVQSVAWATELKNTLSGFFYVAALVFWVRHLQVGEAGGSGRPRREYVWALACFTAAILSKTTTSSWPLAAILLAIYLKKPIRPAMLLRLLPTLGLGFFIGWISVVVEHIGYGRGVPVTLTTAGKIVVAGRSLWFYITKFAWPESLMLVYPRWSVDAANPLQWGWPIGILVGLFLLWRFRRHIGLGPFLCAIFFVVALAPVPFLGINFLYLYSFVADHFIYIPSLPLVLCAGYGVQRALAAAPVFPARIVRIGLVLVLMALTFRHSADFHGLETIWRHNVSLFPNSVVGWMNYGYAVSRRGAFDEEIQAYHNVLSVDPNYAPAYNDMGLAYVAKGDNASAESAFRRSLELDAGLTEARHNLGNVLAQQNRWAEAIPLFEKVLAARPDHLLARLNLSHAYRLEGKPERAKPLIDVAIRQDPNSAGVWYEAAMVSLALGRREEARACLETALRIVPDYPEASAQLRALPRP